jgi:hypothetical protein
MSFLSSILGGIGTVATNVGTTLKDTFTGGLTDAKLKNPVTGSIESASQPGFWGVLAKEAGPTLLKNVKFGGVPIQTPKGPSVSMLKSGRYKGGPALPTQPKGMELSLEDIRKFGESWAKAQAQRALVDAAKKDSYANMTESPSYSAWEDAWGMPKKPTWREVDRKSVV